jgi:hypothetical protein
MIVHGWQVSNNQFLDLAKARAVVVQKKEKFDIHKRLYFACDCTQCNICKVRFICWTQIIMVEITDEALYFDLIATPKTFAFGYNVARKLEKYLGHEVKENDLFYLRHTL